MSRTGTIIFTQCPRRKNSSGDRILSLVFEKCTPSPRRYMQLYNWYLKTGFFRASNTGKTCVLNMLKCVKNGQNYVFDVFYTRVHLIRFATFYYNSPSCKPPSCFPFRIVQIMIDVALKMCVVLVDLLHDGQNVIWLMFRIFFNPTIYFRRMTTVYSRRFKWNNT